LARLSRHCAAEPRPAVWPRRVRVRPGV